MSTRSKLVVWTTCLVSAASMVTATGLLAAQQRAPMSRLAIDSRRSVGTPVVYKNLTLIPIYDSSAPASSGFQTLDEGLRAKTVKVRESKQGGDVNTLYVTNTGTRPVYLMAGEVVLGGQQDRCLGRDVIVKPGRKDLAVTVFCVEHGRWSGRRDFDETALTVAGADIRANAQEGAFAAGRPAVAAANPGLASPAANAQVQSGRTRASLAESTVSEKQQRVWDSVAAKNAKFKAAPSSGTYKEVLNQSGGEAKTTIGPYVKALSGAIPRDPRLVGVAAAVNGEIVAADIFGDSAIFRKLWPKLLRSYAADAAENAGAKLKRTTVREADAKAFLVAAADSKSKLENRSDVSTTVRLESTTSRTFRLNAAGGAGGMGGMGIDGHVHTNVLKK